MLGKDIAGQTLAARASRWWGSVDDAHHSRRVYGGGGSSDLSRGLDFAPVLSDASTDWWTAGAEDRPRTRFRSRGRRAHAHARSGAGAARRYECGQQRYRRRPADPTQVPCMPRATAARRVGACPRAGLHARPRSVAPSVHASRFRTTGSAAPSSHSGDCSHAGAGQRALRDTGRSSATPWGFGRAPRLNRASSIRWRPRSARLRCTRCDPAPTKEEALDAPERPTHRRRVGDAGGSR